MYTCWFNFYVEEVFIEKNDRMQRNVDEKHSPDMPQKRVPTRLSIKEYAV
jgi:hypothetical protein